MASRARELLDFLIGNDFHVRNISVEDAKFLFEFIYTDTLNEEKLERMIESEKTSSRRIQVGSDNDAAQASFPPVVSIDKDGDCCLDYKSSRVNWMLVVNELIRGAIRFGLIRLERLLVHYMIDKFLAVENVLYVLMDALDDEKSALPLVEEVCLSFTKIHIKQLIKLDEFKLLPKHVLLKIVLKL